MKIVFLSRYQGVIHRGVETYVEELARRLSKNHQVEIFSGKDSDNIKKIIKGNWCETFNCEDDIKDKGDGVKSLCIPLDEQNIKGKKCFNCGKEASVACYFGKTY